MSLSLSIRKSPASLTAWRSILVLVCATGPAVWGQQAGPLVEIERSIPPAGIDIGQPTRDRLIAALAGIQKSAARLDNHPLRADVDVLLKAVEFALELNEFYAPRDVGKAEALIALAEERVSQLAASQSPWTTQRGRVIRGYYSRIDGSPQPYGLEIPEDLDQSQPVPLYVWLHGRGDKTTDLHFIHERMNRGGTIKVTDAIVVHPFGRHCIGFKSAGEIDVLEVLQHVQQHYRIDAERIVLMGFSMGGAGVWHLGAHYTDRWVAMSPGAGFAETAQYNRLQPAAYPPIYEQALWGMYDVPDYAWNLLNLPVIAYSGENDKQIQAAQVMEAALAEHGQTLNHVIGPGMGHQYHPDSLAAILAQLRQAVEQGLNRQPQRISLQTRTLRYSRIHSLEIAGLQEHWRETRADAEYQDGRLTIATRNVQSLRWHDSPITEAVVDGQPLSVPPNQLPLTLVLDEQQRWQAGPIPETPLHKQAGLQGPIDDAWLDAFLVVKPSRPSSNALRQAWYEFELQHLQQRWQALFRGRLPIKLDSEVTADDVRDRHLILWGDPENNAWIRRIVDRLPAQWDAEQVGIGPHRFAADTHVPVLIYPNPESPGRYVVINSGPTFRESHDRTNSLQNPKLPDWAILDITQPPDGQTAGRVVAADFFDEEWRVKD